MKLKKIKKITLILSLVLSLPVPVWAADPVEIRESVDKSSVIEGDASVTVKGLTEQGEYSEDTSFDITVQALAGTNSTGDVSAVAYGISNNSGATLNTGANTIRVTAIGGKALEQDCGSDVVAYGVYNDYNAILDTGGNTIFVAVTGGESAVSAGTSSYGIYNFGTLNTGDNTITVTAILGTASDYYDRIFGIMNAGDQQLIVKNNTIIGTGERAVTPAAYAPSAGVSSYGILNNGPLSTENNKIEVTVIGGKGTAFSTPLYASANGYGIQNSGTMDTEDNTIKVTVTGGEAEERGNGYAAGYAIWNREGTLITANNTIEVTATGGKISYSRNETSFADAIAYGIQNDDTIGTQENTIRATAIGGIVEGEVGSAEATAVGIYSSESFIAAGSQKIYAEAIAGIVNNKVDKAYAYALLSVYEGTIQLNSQGETVQLTGDIGVNDAGSIVVSLENDDSYWRPRFQNTYQSAVNGTFGNGSFTIKDGGVLDLAWHANQGGYNFKGSQLNLTGDTIQIGDGATFIVNADLANDVADTITASTTATGTQYVQVAYDPSYLTYETVEGRALVLDFDGANGLGVASTVETPLQTVTFMPTMEGGYLVGIDYTREVSEQGKTASDSYHQQINILRTQWSTLVQRLGDVRNENPESHNGSWARIHGGKLKSDGAYGRNSTMKYGGVQAGYDRMRETGSGKYLAGFLVDYIDADSDFQRGEGNTQSLAFGGYWTWLSPKGHYADVVVKAAHLDTDYDFYYLSGEKASADFTNWGYTMSVEYGYRHDLKKNRYIEPQAQFLVGHLESKNYRSSNGVSLHQDGVNLAMGRLGVLFGWTDENKSSAYLRGSVVHDFSGSGALTSSYGGDRMRIDTAGNTGTTFEVNMGASVIVGKNSHLYAELTKSFGGDVKTDWQANLGWRVKW